MRSWETWEGLSQRSCWPLSLHFGSSRESVGPHRAGATPPRLNLPRKTRPLTTDPCTNESVDGEHTFCSRVSDVQNQHLPNHPLQPPFWSSASSSARDESSGCSRSFWVPSWPQWGEMPRPDTRVPQSLRQASREPLADGTSRLLAGGKKGNQGAASPRPPALRQPVQALSAAQPPPEQG